LRPIFPEGGNEAVQGLRQWYVVHSKPHKEEVAKFQLQRKGLEVFFPRLQLPAFLNKPQRIIPLFSGYLFVRIQTFEEYYRTIWSPGVKGLVSFNGVPAPLDDTIVAFLKQQATAEGIFIAYSKLIVGREMRISQGPFEGLVGIIQKPPNAKGRIKMLLELLNRQVQAEIPVNHIGNEWSVFGEKERDQTL
jgi:transcriptional antiterminator RfaH